GGAQEDHRTDATPRLRRPALHPGRPVFRAAGTPRHHRQLQPRSGDGVLERHQGDVSRVRPGEVKEERPGGAAPWTPAKGGAFGILFRFVETGWADKVVETPRWPPLFYKPRW